jgi:hypothetical protein
MIIDKMARVGRLAPENSIGISIRIFIINTVITKQLTET